MEILAIETSCDDTGIAILSAKGGPASGGDEFEVLANVVSSQTALGKKYGGVFPAMAKREHQKNLVPTLVKVLKKAEMLNSKVINETPDFKNILEREPELEKNLISLFKKYGKPDVDLIAVTNGPGLEPCLWVGVNFAKAISQFWNIPVVAVNHIESHILVNLLENPEIKFPAVALVVSGGHTQIILIKKIGKYKILGETRDDAAGECFDKCAKILGLGYPGGPIISKLAEIDPRGLSANRPRGSIKLPRPMFNTKDYDFSFSGLKTAVLYAWQKISAVKFHSSENLRQQKINMAAEVQQAIIDVLVKKTIKAAKDYKIKTLILGGGVTANKELRKQFKEALNTSSRVEVFVPTPNLSTDNALMTAITGFYHQKNKIPWEKLQAESNLRIGEKVIK